MDTKDAGIITGIIASIVVLLFVALMGADVANSTKEKMAWNCDHHGAVYINEVRYECHKEETEP